jgi:hypothetical protein
VNIVVHEQLKSRALPGSAIRHLMRRHRITIRGLAKTHGLTMKRVREVRAEGAKPGFASNEWHWLITGKWFEELSIPAAKALAGRMTTPSKGLVSLSALCDDAKRHVE